MPANANVFIRYGPYKAVGVVQHRDSRLKGLQGTFHSQHFHLCNQGMYERESKLHQHMEVHGRGKISDDEQEN